MTTRAPAVLIIEQVLVGIPFKQRDYVLNFFISKYKVHTIKTLFTSTFILLGVLKNKIMFTSQLVNSIMNSNKKVHPTWHVLQVILADVVNKEKGVSSLLRINFFGTWTLKRYYKKIAKNRSNFSILSCGCGVNSWKYFPEAQKTA